MPLLDVSDVLGDPDFADTFTVLRKSQTISSGGIATDGTPTTTPNVSGVVQPDRGRALQRMAEGSTLTDAIKIFTKYALTAGDGAIEADQIVWHGATYVVVNIMDWSGYGDGWIQATCDLNQLNPSS
jgi:hypothetical protein